MKKNKACKKETTQEPTNIRYIYIKLNLYKHEIYLDKTLFTYVKLVQGRLEGWRVANSNFTVSKTSRAPKFI